MLPVNQYLDFLVPSWLMDVTNRDNRMAAIIFISKKSGFGTTFSKLSSWVLGIRVSLITYYPYKSCSKRQPCRWSNVYGIHNFLFEMIYRFETREVYGVMIVRKLHYLQYPNNRPIFVRKKNDKTVQHLKKTRNERIRKF